MDARRFHIHCGPHGRATLHTLAMFPHFSKTARPHACQPPKQAGLVKRLFDIDCLNASLSLRTLVITLAMITLGLCCAVVIEQVVFKHTSARLQKLQEEMRNITLRCDKSFHGSNFILCADIGTEALLEIEDFQDADLLKRFDVKELEIIKAYEGHEITSTERDTELDRLNEETNKEIEERDKILPRLAAAISKIR